MEYRDRKRSQKRAKRREREEERWASMAGPVEVRRLDDDTRGRAEEERPERNSRADEHEDQDDELRPRRGQS